MRGLILLNPSSGSDDTSVEALTERFGAHDVEECAPDDLAERLRAAADESLDFIGIAGGDGTIRSAVQVLAGGSVPLLPIPTGTRNHFARDVGVTDLDAAELAAREGRVRTIDIGQVNDHYFVNNSSIGLYPKMVIRREAHEHRLPKAVATVVAAVQQLRRGDRVSVTTDGRRRHAWMVFVGNGRYGEGMLDLADRESLDENLLDVRIARADRPLARLRIVGALVLGRLANSQVLSQFTCARTELRLDRHEVDVALDGEVEQLHSPLEYCSVAGGLSVLVPPIEAT